VIGFVAVEIPVGAEADVEAVAFRATNENSKENPHLFVP